MPTGIGIASGIGFLQNKSGQPSPNPPVPLTDATFQTAMNDILAQDVNGNFDLFPYGKIQDWDVSQVTTATLAFNGRLNFISCKSNFR